MLDVRRDILIPRYYDPRIHESLDAISGTHRLVSLDDLVAEGVLQHDQGNYVPKIYYGAGPYPYIRTSDLANWEIKASPKHGVPEGVYRHYAAKQNVRPGDILLVHEGTYLIGSAAMVTEFDGPLIYQHHLARLRVKPGSPFGPYYLLAVLESSLVQRQIRSKQFSADIIDSVVGRLGEVLIPVPKDTVQVRSTEERVERIVLGRAELRERVAYVTQALDDWLRGDATRSLSDICSWRPSSEQYEGRPAFLGGRSPFLAFSCMAGDVRNDILLPKYYDPLVAQGLAKYASRCDLLSIRELFERGLVSLDTGDEIGRLNYGSGLIPFVRTSDFGSWELKRESKHSVSRDVFELWGTAQDVRSDDILLVRDGTYLVGTSVLIDTHDLPLLYCGGIIKLRCMRRDVLHPVLLFALLNLPFVRRQMRNKQFTRDVIDTLGRRLVEVVLPVPRSESVCSDIVTHLGAMLRERILLRVELQQAIQSMSGDVEESMDEKITGKR